MHLFCFGFGYVAKLIASDLGSNWKISGSHTGARNSENNEYIFNDKIFFNPEILNDVTHILISIPPNENGDPVFLSFIEYIKTLPKLEWIGYFSSTSVYGDHQGNWVNEESSTDASDVLGKKRLLAEKQWLESGLPINILRLSAIYGKGRSVIDTIRAGKAVRILKENHYFSRTHVKDISHITRLMMASHSLGEIYNIADDMPSPQHEVVSFGCKLLGVIPPSLVKFEDTNLSEAMKRYYSSSKKVSNHKIKDFYKLSLKFSSYKEGLLDCI